MDIVLVGLDESVYRWSDNDRFQTRDKLRGHETHMT
jgi:hypothetical protein